MERQTKHSIDIFFVIILFSLYTFCALFLTVIGADVYRVNVEDSQANYNTRTSILYVNEKIRQNETASAVIVDEYDGTDALVLSQTINDYNIKTWLYIENNYLCEATLSENVTLIPNIGQKIMPMNEIDFVLNDDGLLEITMLDESNVSHSTTVFLECAKSEVAE